MKNLILSLATVLFAVSANANNYCNVYVESIEAPAFRSSVPNYNENELRAISALQSQGYQIVYDILQASIKVKTEAWCLMGTGAGTERFCELAPGYISMTDLATGQKVVFRGESRDSFFFEANPTSAHREALSQIPACR